MRLGTNGMTTIPKETDELYFIKGDFQKLGCPIFLAEEVGIFFLENVLCFNRRLLNLLFCYALFSIPQGKREAVEGEK